MENNRIPKKSKETKADKFWSIFLFTKNGRVKSTFIVNSFSLSILFLAVYGLCYFMLIDPLNSLVSAHVSTSLASLVESLVPALIGSVLCCSLFFVIKDKKLVPAGYVWLLLFSLFAFFYLLFSLAPQDRGTFLSLYALIVPAPLITGGGFSAYLYMKRRRIQETPVQELPKWKRK